MAFRKRKYSPPETSLRLTPMNAAQKPSGGPGISHGKFHHTQQAAPSLLMLQ